MRKSWPARADSLLIIDSVGNEICKTPFLEPVNTHNAYGSCIFKGKLIFGFGPFNNNFPNSIVPLEFSPDYSYVHFGTPILTNIEGRLDMAGCSKDIELPDCKIKTNTSQILDNQIHISPNPFNKEIYVETEELSLERIYIFDINGRTVIEGAPKMHRLDTTNLEPGVYFLVIVTESGVAHRSIVKQ